MTDSSAPPRPADQSELAELVEQILAETKRQGASTAAATVGINSGLTVTVRMGELETIEHHQGKHLGVTVYFGQKTGAATSTDLGSKAVRETVSAACRIARYTEEDPYAGLADAILMAKAIPDLDLYHPWDLAPESATRLALDAETAGRELDARISNSDGAMVDSHETSHVYGNTHGFVAGYRSSRHSISCSLIAQSGTEKQRDYWHTVARSHLELDAAGSVGTTAARRTVRRLGARQISTRTVPVLFAAEQATRLFRSLIAAIKGSSLYRNASFLLDHLDKQVFSDHVQIEERPHIPRGFGSAPFDFEGVSTQDRFLVRDGVLRGYVLDSYAARRLGMTTTGNAGGVHNLVVTPGDEDLAGLLKTMDTGLLVTELMGMGINIVTGDYSRGAAGFWVERGEIQHPVHEVTIAGNLRDMFLGIRAIGRDVDARSSIHTGSVLVERMTVAGG